MLSRSSGLRIVFFSCCVVFFTGQGQLVAYAKSSAMLVLLEQKKQVASSLLQRGLHDEATDAFLGLLREEPESDEVNVGLLVAAFKAKRYPHALFACERLLVKYPNDIGLRLQLAKIYMALNEPESARQELRKIKQIAPQFSDSAVEKMAQSLEQAFSRWTYGGTLLAGYIYDSNSNAGPKSERLTLGKFVDLRIPGAKATEAHGFFTAAAVNMGYRIKEDGAWWWVGDVAGYQRWNTSAGVLYNKSLTWGRGATGVRHIGGKSLWELRVKGEQIYQEHAKDPAQTVYTYGAEMTAARMLTDKVQVFARAGLENRHFSESKLQNGQYWSLGAYTRYFFGASNHEVMAGAQLTGAQAKNSAYSYSAVEPTIRLTVYLPRNTFLTSHVLLRHEDYKGPATGLETEDRQDNHWRVGAGAGWDITSSLTLSISYEYVKNYSNSALYQYNQEIVTTSMALKF